MEHFYPETSSEVSVATVERLFCRQCPVIEYCHVASLGERHGLWAGKSRSVRERARSKAKITLTDLGEEQAPGRTHNAAQKMWETGKSAVDVLTPLIGAAKARVWMAST